jgi:hypothetical protein
MEGERFHNEGKQRAEEGGQEGEQEGRARGRVRRVREGRAKGG